LSQHANYFLKELVRELEGEYALDYFEIMFNQSHDGFAEMVVEFRGKRIFQKQIAIRGLTASNGVDMSDDDLRSVVTNTMRSHLNLVAQMHFARLEPMFPGSIAEVTMGFSPATHQKTVAVKFKNGHIAEGPEHEVKSDLFLARCIMLYDLPPI
jgi:hypothetical protein